MARTPEPRLDILDCLATSDGPVLKAKTKDRSLTSISWIMRAARILLATIFLMSLKISDQAGEAKLTSSNITKTSNGTVKIMFLESQFWSNHKTSNSWLAASFKKAAPHALTVAAGQKLSESHM